MDLHDVAKAVLIVLTGGPCAGKTTGMTYLTQKLGDHGLYPIVVPEAATLLIQNGVTPVGGMFNVRTFEEAVIDLTVRLETTWTEAAAKVPHLRPVLLCDRGIMDARAYMPEDMFWEALRERGLDVRSARDERYSGIIHMRSAACGAEPFYTAANNVARFETLEEARAVDERTLRAWIGHPHLRVVGNDVGSFDEKIRSVLAHASRMLGIPEPIEVERKYLVAPVDLATERVHFADVAIEQFYLAIPDAHDRVVRVRRRKQYGVPTFYKTTKHDIAPGVRGETERFIDAREYEWSRSFTEPGTRVIRKTRRCFVYENQYFELDAFHDGVLPGAMLLEIELTDINDKVTIPPFVRVIEDVTNDPRYTNRALAKI